MKNIEIEYKVMIDEKGYLKLIESLDSFPCHLYIQENIYFDSKERKLKENHVSFRIRKILNLNRIVATIKEDLKEGKLETECSMKTDNISDIPNEIELIINKNGLNKNDLIELGRLTTTRHEYEYNGVVLCVDRNTYKDVIDYEVECESSSMEYSKKVIESLLNELQISYVISPSSKQKRATESN